MDAMAGICARIRLVADATGKSGRTIAKAAGLGEGHVNALKAGTLKNVEVLTLEKIAAAVGVTFEYLAAGVGPGPEAQLAREIDGHPSVSFRAGARAFLELEQHSEAARAVVVEVTKAPFDDNYRWTPEAWLDELRAELRRRARGIRLTSV